LKGHSGVYRLVALTSTPGGLIRLTITRKPAMGKDFLPENFLLSTPASEKLYFEFAKDLPIFDYHCHIPPGDFGDTKAGEFLYSKNGKNTPIRTKVTTSLH
jgi:Glucuronate isomerase